MPKKKADERATGGGARKEGSTPNPVRREDLAKHNGASPYQPVWIAVRGYVFDVSSDRHAFGKGGPLHLCAGKEISRAIALGPPPRTDSSTPAAPSPSQGSSNEGTLIGSKQDEADSGHEGLRSRAKKGPQQDGAHSGSLPQPPQPQQNGTSPSQLKITLCQGEIGKDKLDDCSNEQLARVEDVLRLCRSKYLQIGRLPDDGSDDPNPIFGQYTTLSTIVVIVWFTLLLTCGIVFSVNALTGWGEDYISSLLPNRAGADPSRAFSKRRLRAFMSLGGMLPSDMLDEEDLDG